MAAVMHRKDRACAARDRRFDSPRVDIERVGFNVDEYRPRTHVLNDVHACRKCQWGRDHLVAGPKPHERECGVQRGRARVQRERPGGRNVSGEFSLKALGLRLHFEDDGKHGRLLSIG